MAQLLTPEQQRQIFRLRFDGELEPEFWSDWAKKIRRPARIICIAGLILCATFVAMSFVLLDPESRGANLLSVGAVVPVLLATYLLAGNSRAWEKVNPWLLWLAVAAMAAANGYSMLSRNQEVYERAIISNWLFFSVVVIGSGLALVRNAGISVLILLASYYYMSVVARPLDEPARTSNWMILMQTSFFAMAAAYVAEVRARREFLLGHLLEQERSKTAELLMNVLPPEIARRLMSRPGILAERHDDASVLFADIVDFTPFASSREPDEVVGFLNEVFSGIDTLVERFGLEKIKTVGDAYMVAGGVLDHEDDHLQRMAELALDIRDEARKLDIKMRIGIHCGPLVAGVIGKTKYLYDLWGETVNTASRMESHGLPGEIQVTAAVARRLEGQFACDHRGLVDVKGIGKVDTYTLVGRLPHAEAFDAKTSEAPGIRFSPQSR